MPDEKAPAAGAAGGLFRSLLPERSVEDVLSGTLRIKFGGSEFAMPVLVIDEADKWRVQLAKEFASILAALEGTTDAAGALAFISGHTPKMMELLRLYDASGALPDDAWIKSHASEPEVLRAFMLVLAASYPFVAAALDILAANPQALKIVLEEFRTPTQTAGGGLTSTPPEPTAGPSGKSGRRSRTSNSTAT